MYVDPGRVRATCNPTGATQQDTTDKATPAGMTDEALDVAIGDAQAYVDARLAQAYSVPFDEPPPDLVAMLTAFQAAYLAVLTLRRTKDLEPNDPYRLRQQWVDATLDKLASGELVIPSDEETEEEGVSVVNLYDGHMWLPQDFDMREVERNYSPWGVWAP